MRDIIRNISIIDNMLFSSTRYQIKKDDRQLLDFFPPVSIFLSGLIFLIGIVWAITQYHTPNGMYDFLHQYLSELGVRKDYIFTTSNGVSQQRFAPEHPEIFNITLFASGFLMIPYFAFSYRQMRNSNRISNLFLILSTIFGILSGPFMIGVGVFDISYNSSVPWKEHGFWAAGLYVLIGITSITWFVMLLTAKMLPYRSTKWIILDILLLLTLVGLTVINIADGVGLLLVTDIPILNSYPIQLYQKLIPIAFFSYYGLVVGTRLTKTKYDNTPVLGTTIHCTNCGVNNPLDAPFCTNCGVKLL